jgi:tight adherence protein C
LALALVGTFMAIFLGGVLVDILLRERNRPVALLQTQLGAVPDGTELREQELEGSLLDRAFIPAAKGIGRKIARITPIDLHKRIAELLVLGGSPRGLDPERIVAMKIIGGGAGAVGGALLMTLAGGSMMIEWLFVGIVGAIGYLLPTMQLKIKADARQKAIQRQLPDVMDLLTISVEAGLGMDAAVAQVIKNVPGPLAEEFARLSQEIQIGVARAEAFRHLGERTSVAELRGFVLSMIQADLFGVSIANVLRAQSRELRQKRRQRAEEIAQKIPVKLLFPMIFLILPATFIVVLGPGGIKIYEQFFGS